MKIDHEQFMRLAMEEAKKGEGKTSPYPFVGCMVVRGGRVIGRGHTQPQGKEHAEVNVLKSLGKKARGATLYSTLEPCHANDYKECDPCSQWIKRSGIRTVVWGARDPNIKNKEGSTRWLTRAKVRVIGKVLQKECERLHEIFLVSLAKKRPFVLVNVAASLDGKITWKKEHSSKGQFSSDGAFKKIHELRGRMDAIAVGIHTVEIDDPRLTARIRGRNNPHRVIIDSHCRISPNARVFDAPNGSVIIVTTAYAPLIKRDELKEHGAEVVVVNDNQHGQVDLKEAMKVLYRDYHITSLMIEGGGELIASAFKARLVDKVQLWYAPLLIGGGGTPTAMEGEPLERFGDAIKLSELTTEKVGEDVFVSGYIRRI